MLHTCQSCGEAWSGEYILLHLSQFVEIRNSNSLAVRRCPNCSTPVGIPFVTTKRSLARAFITRLAGEYYLGTKMFHSSDRNLSPMSRSVAEVYNALRT